MFLTEITRDVHAESLGVSFDESKIMHLPVDLVSERHAGAMPPKKIVSIARIDVVMKNYIFHLPRIVASLREKGHDVSCEIYGLGPRSDEIALQNLIESTCPDGSVTYHGEVPYTRVSDVLADCFVAVGMGTSAVESSMFGVPTIVAIAYSNQPLSYGFLHEMPPGAIGDDLRRDGAKSIEVLIENLCKYSEEQYIELCRRHVEYARHYDTDRICRTLLEFLRECQRVPHGSLELSIWRILEVNFVRGVKFLVRRIRRIEIDDDPKKKVAS